MDRGRCPSERIPGKNLSTTMRKSGKINKKTALEFVRRLLAIHIPVNGETGSAVARASGPAGWIQDARVSLGKLQSGDGTLQVGKFMDGKFVRPDTDPA